jgi:CRISPR-associated protein (TIGR03984 family)
MSIEKATETIKAAFPEKAWAYIVLDFAVCIGVWDGARIVFSEACDVENAQELRVFDANRELRFLKTPSGYAERDSNAYGQKHGIDETYVMYGEKAESKNAYTALSETRGGSYDFPKQLVFPSEHVTLKLGIRHFAKYNPIPVLKPDECAENGLPVSGRAAFEIYDYAYTGFFYEDGTEVSL